MGWSENTEGGASVAERAAPPGIEVQFIKKLAAEWRDEKRASVTALRESKRQDLASLGPVYGAPYMEDMILATINATTNRFVHALEQAVFGRHIAADEQWSDTLTFSSSVHDFRARAAGMTEQAMRGSDHMIEANDRALYEDLTARLASQIGPKIVQYREMQSKRGVV